MRQIFDWFLIVTVGLGAGVLLSAPASAQETQSTETQSTETGTGVVELQVGDIVPDFTLTDQSGEEHTLSELAQEKKVAVVFYRSAEW